MYVKLFNENFRSINQFSQLNRLLSKLCSNLTRKKQRKVKLMSLILPSKLFTMRFNFVITPLLSLIWTWMIRWNYYYFVINMICRISRLVWHHSIAKFNCILGLRWSSFNPGNFRLVRLCTRQMFAPFKCFQSRRKMHWICSKLYQRWNSHRRYETSWQRFYNQNPFKCLLHCDWNLIFVQSCLFHLSKIVFL